MTSIDGSVLALGTGFVVTTAGALWKAANLRSEVFSNYHRRTALAQAGLDERASTALRRLAEKVNETLGELERFDPNRALADPSDLRTQINDVAQLLSTRTHLPMYFHRMLKIGPILMALLVILLVSLLIALTYFSGWKRARGLGYTGLWVAIGSLGLIGAVTAYHFSLVHRFNTAEILSVSNDG